MEGNCYFGGMRINLYFKWQNNIAVKSALWCTSPDAFENAQWSRDWFKEGSAHVYMRIYDTFMEIHLFDWELDGFLTRMREMNVDCTVDFRVTFHKVE